MRPVMLVLFSLSGALTACGGGEAPAETRDLDAAKQQVHAFAPWDKSHEKLVSELGEADSVDGDTYVWQKPTEGDQCQRLTVQKMGESVGSVDLSTGPCA